MTQPGRLTEVFDKCRAEERAALIGYLPNGYPDLDTSIELMTTLVREVATSSKWGSRTRIR